MKIEAFLRHKDYREAADSGLLLWRQNFIFFLPFFAVPFWVFAFVLRIFLPDNLQYYSWIIIWFLKPLFDRIILHIISIRFFEKDAGSKRLCQGIGKSLCRGLAGDLLWRRFSPFRSVMMPVRVLERNLKSEKNITERKNNLKKNGIGYCIVLTIWGIAAEIALLTGQILFTAAMAEITSRGFISSIESFLNVEIYLYAAWCINYMLVESIYVCMGFSLYVNSRIKAEGWDIEIIFKSFAEKYVNRENTAC
jgi:hypothetical protein